MIQSNMVIQKDYLNEHEAYKQNISNFGKLSKGSTQNRKEAWKEEIKNIQQIRQDISAPQQAGQTELFGGLRSGKTRMQKHRDENPELNQLRQQLYDNNRGQLQLSDIEKAAKIGTLPIFSEKHTICV